MRYLTAAIFGRWLLPSPWRIVATESGQGTTVITLANRREQKRFDAIGVDYPDALSTALRAIKEGRQ